MILTFEVGGELVRVQVTSDRELFWNGRLTNDEWIAFSQLSGMSKQDPLAVRLTELIVRSLPTKEDVADYVIYELRKTGLRHVRTEL